MKKLFLLGILALGIGVLSQTGFAKAHYAIDGNCPVAIVLAGKVIPGSSKYSAEYEGKTYLFPGAGARDMFVKNPVKFTRGLEAKYQRVK